MQTSIKNKKLLYHLTALDNIESILKNGLVARKNITNFTDVAEQNIIDFRDEKGISKLIPFHFLKSTPFSGIVQKNYTNIEFVYITIHRDMAKEKNFGIFPTHPKHMSPLKLFDYDEGMKNIDWELMDKRDYTNYECKEVCMAECISPHKSIPAKAFHSIIVKSEETKKYIEKLCQNIFGYDNCKPNFFIDIEPKSFIGI